MTLILISNVVVPTSARQLMSTTTTSPDEKEVMMNIGTANRGHDEKHDHQVQVDDPTSKNYNVEKKEERFDKNQIIPPILPFPFGFPFPRPSFPFPRAAFPFPRFPLPTPFVPGLPWPISPDAVSSFPYPPVDMPASPYLHTTPSSPPN
ncbi:hypothetical protein JHK82_024399 [Glycine max]|nr:hypothetical protein JHK85_024985 [Glycine max]KAG5133211.1 hypothetical protein JHK82_024399 [Glycine max]